MNDLIFGCSVTNKTSSGNYDYYLHSRIDNYAVIQKAKTDGASYLFRVILENEDIATVWANAVNESYIRPDQQWESLKKYVINKMQNYQRLLGSDAENLV